MGHFARDCPQRGRGKQESSGKSTSKSAAFTASASASAPTLDSFSVHQLEQHLAQRKLAEETSQLQNASTDEAQVGTVLSTSEVSDVVGPRPHITLEIEGVSAKALVDTGSQSTIISRSLLHKVAVKLRANGKPIPTLVLPTVKLYGKDGEDGKRELDISAQVELTTVVDGISVRVPMLIQPKSEQKWKLTDSVLTTER